MAQCAGPLERRVRRDSSGLSSGAGRGPLGLPESPWFSGGGVIIDVKQGSGEQANRRQQDHRLDKVLVHGDGTKEVHRLAGYD